MLEGSLRTWNQISFGWKVNDRLRFVLNPRFVINHNNKQTKGFQFQNPVFGISGTWFKKGELLVGGGMNTIIPQLRTQSTKERGQLFNPGGLSICKL